MAARPYPETIPAHAPARAGYVRPVAPGSGNALLGKSTKKPSAPAKDDRRAGRYLLRERLGRLTNNKRVAGCGVRRISKEHLPTVRCKGDALARVAHYTGLQLCGSIHLCPVCAPRIRQERANDVDICAVKWIAEHGIGSVLFLTLTLPHWDGDALALVLGVVRDAFGELVAGRGWQATKHAYDLKHYIRSHDATVGANGWHPHLHALLFGTRTLSAEELEHLEDDIHRRWTIGVTRGGLVRAPSRAHGVKLEQARHRADIAHYLCQVVTGGDESAQQTPVALEMTRSDLKRSRHEGQRTPWQLLEDLTARRAAEGEWTPAIDAADEKDLALWLEWEASTKGMQAIRWSKGLRKHVGLAAAKTDDEIVNEEVGGVDAYYFDTLEEWTAVAKTPGARAALLRVAETGTPGDIKRAVIDVVIAWRDRCAKRLRGKYGGRYDDPDKSPAELRQILFPDDGGSMHA